VGAYTSRNDAKEESMGTWRRRALILAAFAGMAALAAAAVACGDSGSSYDGSSSSSPTASGVATAASTPAADGSAPSGVVLGTGDTSLGQVLVDASNMTLYVFAKDTANDGKSACYGQCATNWPPLTVTSVPPAPSGAMGSLATITRDDGKMQLTYNGLPLYRYIADKAPGDTGGDGVGGVWSVAKP
jgi:predicted lipoprotein with Yx(FWY)xxD motif